MQVQGEGFTAKVSEDGKSMTIEVDLTRKGTLSQSGKSLVIASSRGATHVNGVKINLNVYKPNR